MDRLICLSAMLVSLFLLVTFGESRSHLFENSDEAEAVVNSVTGIDIFRRRRFSALWELGFMVRCTTGKGLISAIYDYAWYGCYCGIGGEGEPVDGTDRCCMIHDHCYDVAFRTRDCPLEPDVYFIPYRGHYSMSSCLTSKPNITCDPPHSYQWWHPYPACAAAICQCDAAVSKCLGRNTFHPQNALYPKGTCKHGPPVTLEPAAAITTEDNTSLFPFQSTDASGIETELPDDSNLNDNALSPVNRNSIDDEPMSSYSEERLSKKKAQFKQDNWPTYFKGTP